MRKSLSILLLGLLLSCESENKKEESKALLIEREKGSLHFKEPEVKANPLPRYAWEKDSPFPRINKEFFRCMGSKLHPMKKQEGKLPPLSDCDGFSAHSLPIKNGEEFIYPCLIELLNEIQKRTNHRVIITSGHRCLKHHLYVKLPEEKKASKHLMGAEVAFYVKGLEKSPQTVLKAIEEYYREHPVFGQEAAFQFKQSDQDDLQVSLRPYLNKEILVKLYLPEEGRDGDTNHNFSYFKMQVRWDRNSKKSVPFRWDEAEKNLFQW